MSATRIDFARFAARIIAPLADANSVLTEKRAAQRAFNGRINAKTLTGYATCAVIIAELMAADAWTTGKVKGGSASATLKAAILVEAEAQKVNESRAKRLVEKAAAILSGKKQVPGVMEAARAGSADDVVAALDAAKITTEAHLIKHVEGEPAKDAVKDILALIEKLDDAQRARLDAALAPKKDTASDLPKVSPAARGAGRAQASVAVHSAA